MLPELVKELADLSNSFEGGYDSCFANKYPEIDIYEDDKNIDLEASVSGFDKQDISIKIEDNLLTISGKQKVQDTARTYVKRERFYGNFERSFNLPKNIKIEDIKAENKNGLLVVTLPFLEEKNKKITIEIQ